MASAISQLKRFIKTIYQKLFLENINVAIIGYQQSGKSSLMLALFDNPKKVTTETKTSYVKKYNKGKFSYNCFDLSSEKTYRSAWDVFIDKADLIIFCVDITCSHEILVASNEMLWALMGKQNAKKSPIAVVVTKIDLEPAYELPEIMYMLHLGKIEDREMACYTVSSKTMASIDELFEWVVSVASTSSTAFGNIGI